MIQNLDGYLFSNEEVRTLNQHALELGKTKGAEIEIQLKSSEDFSDAVILAVRPNTTAFTPIAHIEKIVVNGQTGFYPQSCGDNGPLGPSSTYPTLLEALKYASIFVGAVIDVDRRRDLESAHVVTASDSREVLSSVEKAVAKRFADAIGKLVNSEGLLNIHDGFAPGSASIGIGYYYRNEPILLGSFVLSRSQSGETFCSVKAAGMSTRLPGPDYYPSLSDAIVASAEFFAHMAQHTSKVLRKPWWRRLFG